MARRWDSIMLHHSAGPDGKAVDWTGIRRQHTEERGWRDVGYHFGVERVEGAYKALIGRPLHLQGAHEPTANRSAIGVCMVGNYSDVAPPDEMLQVLGRLILVPLMELLDIPESGILFHRDKKATECPGARFTREHVKRAIEFGTV